MSQIILKIAHPAFECLALGWVTGDFQPYLDRLPDEFTFWYPNGKYRGKFTGRKGRVQVSARCRDPIEAGDRLLRVRTRVFNPEYRSKTLPSGSIMTQNTAEYACAYCGEPNLVFVDLSAGGQQAYVEACQVCCQPNILTIQVDEETLDISVNSECEA